MDFLALNKSKKYTDNSILGIDGVLAGKNCTILSKVDSEDGSTIIFKWTADDGTAKTTTCFIPRGLKGETGEKGDKGDKGEQGNAGANGINGNDGVGISDITSTQNGNTVSFNFSLTNGTTKSFSFTLPTGGGSSSETTVPDNAFILADNEPFLLSDGTYFEFAD